MSTESERRSYLMKRFSGQAGESFVCLTDGTFELPLGPTADRKLRDYPRHRTWMHDVPLDGENFLRLSLFRSKLS